MAISFIRPGKSTSSPGGAVPFHLSACTRCASPTVHGAALCRANRSNFAPLRTDALIYAPGLITLIYIEIDRPAPIKRLSAVPAHYSSFETVWSPPEKWPVTAELKTEKNRPVSRSIRAHPGKSTTRRVFGLFTLLQQPQKKTDGSGSAIYRRRRN